MVTGAQRDVCRRLQERILDDRDQHDKTGDNKRGGKGMHKVNRSCEYRGGKM